MEHIVLRNSELKVSRLCIGGCPLGGYGWGNIEMANLIDAVKVAVESGINFFDTADTYGIGESEKTLSKALGNELNNVVIATKFGVRIDNGKTFYDNSRKWINKACEDSLKRLNREYIDLYQMHYWDGITPIDDIIDTLDRLKYKGYIRYFGLSNIHLSDKKLITELEYLKGKFVGFQDEYSLACRKNEKDIVQLSNELELTPMTWGSLGQGILTGKYDENSIFNSNDRRSREIYVNFHGEKLKKNLEIVKVIKDIANIRNKKISAVAIRFILDNFKESIVLTGVKSPIQVLNNIESLDWRLNTDEMNRLLKISEE